MSDVTPECYQESPARVFLNRLTEIDRKDNDLFLNKQIIFDFL